MRQILAIEEYGIGDAVLSTPALEALRRAHPSARISSLCSAGAAELREACPLLDEVLVSGAGKRCEAVGPFDLVLDLTGKLRTAALGLRLRSAVRVGTPWWPSRALAGLFYTHVVAARPGVHVLEHKHDLALAAGASGPAPMPRIWTTDSDEQAARDWMRERGVDVGHGVVALNPGARSRGRAWSVEGFASVCGALRRDFGCQVVIVGGSEDVPAARQVERLSGTRAALAAGELSLREQAALLAQCDACVSVDSGLMHAAATVGTPVAALFGRSDASWSGPRGNGHRVITAGLPCAPCRGRPHSRRSPCLRRFECMRAITPERVMEVLSRMLVRTANAVS